MLYRQGYFTQTVDADGRQRAEYHDNDFDDLPIAPVRRADGGDLTVDVQFPGRNVLVKLWQARVGHVTLYLLDTDLPENAERDRDIAHRLYGGDRVTRLEQELVLGAACARSPRSAASPRYGTSTRVTRLSWFSSACALVQEGLGLDAALEGVAANTVFTTHTPVPAGHDHFAEAVVLPYLKACFGEANVAALGRPAGGDFNMTALAIRGSRYQNGVSRIHGGVSARLLKDYWPQIAPEENPVGYVTNGVHVATFLAPEWSEVLDRFLGVGWMHRLGHPGIWEKIRAIPDHIFGACARTSRRGCSTWCATACRCSAQPRQRVAPRRAAQVRRPGNPNVLTVGFGRRFATYKRATLLFNDLDNLRRLLADRARQVLFLFAGKAHPADEPAQELIRTLVHLSRQDEFAGRILFVEGYDLHIARRPVSGRRRMAQQPSAPARSLWHLGHEGRDERRHQSLDPRRLVGRGLRRRERVGDQAGLARSRPAPARRRGSAHALRDPAGPVIPLYYDRTEGGYSPGWMKIAKRSMASLLPRYDASRMLGEYVSKYYIPPHARATAIRRKVRRREGVGRMESQGSGGMERRGRAGSTAPKPASSSANRFSSMSRSS